MPRGGNKPHGRNQLEQAPLVQTQSRRLKVRRQFTTRRLVKLKALSPLQQTVQLEELITDSKESITDNYDDFLIESFKISVVDFTLGEESQDKTCLILDMCPDFNTQVPNKSSEMLRMAQRRRAILNKYNFEGIRMSDVNRPVFSVTGSDNQFRHGWITTISSPTDWYGFDMMADADCTVYLDVTANVSFRGYQ